MKSEGFYQYKAMAERIKKGKGYAKVRKGTDFYQNRLYFINKGKVEKLADNIKSHRIPKYKEIHRYLTTGKEKFKTPLVKKLIKQKISLNEFLKNLGTNGYNSRLVLQQYKRKNLNPDFWKKIRKKIGEAHFRHSKTEYDLIDKKGLSKKDLRDLREIAYLKYKKNKK